MGSFATILGFLSGLGGWEILLILMVLLIFFGAKKIPELARGLGKGIREFKDATKEIKDEIIEVIMRRLEIDRDNVVINLTQEGRNSVLVAEVPLQVNGRHA